MNFKEPIENEVTDKKVVSDEKQIVQYKESPSHILEISQMSKSLVHNSSSGSSIDAKE